MDVVDVVLLMAGVVIILLVTADAVQVTLGVRPRSRRRAPSLVFYRAALRLFRRLTRTMDDERTERWLAWFGPASILSLLVFWFAGHALGFALIWVALPAAFGEAVTFAEALYFSGVTYLTIGFGDIVPISDAARYLGVLQGLLGVVMVALVLGFLSTIYGFYVDRERRLTSLDVPGRDRIRPIDLVGWLRSGPRGEDRLVGFLEAWSQWAADLVTWHTTYPLLALFRSQHPGQSWVTALGLVTDASVVTLVAYDGDHPEAELLYRRGVQAINQSGPLRTREEVADPITREMWDEGHRLATEYGLDLGDIDESFEEMHRLRSAYVGALEALIDGLSAPRGFWSSSSAKVPRHNRGRRSGE